MFEKNLPSWYSSINFLITNIDSIRNLNSLKVHTRVHVLNDCLFEYYMKEWDSQIPTHSDKEIS